MRAWVLFPALIALPLGVPDARDALAPLEPILDPESDASRETPATEPGDGPRLDDATEEEPPFDAPPPSADAPPDEATPAEPVDAPEVPEVLQPEGAPEEDEPVSLAARGETPPASPERAATAISLAIALGLVGAILVCFDARGWLADLRE